jgi:hypothetical protein
MTEYKLALNSTKANRLYNLIGGMRGEGAMKFQRRQVQSKLAKAFALDEDKPYRGEFPNGDGATLRAEITVTRRELDALWFAIVDEAGKVESNGVDFFVFESAAKSLRLHSRWQTHFGVLASPESDLPVDGEDEVDAAVEA